MAEWIDALAADALPSGDRWLVRGGGREIALFNVDGRVCAIDDSCPRNGASLATGQLDGTMTVVCRACSVRFDLGSGRMRGGTLRVRTYPVRVLHGRIEIDVVPEYGAAAGTLL